MKTKRTTKPLVTFEGGRDQTALMLASLGQSNRYIKEATGLSDHQITYRLTKAKANDEGRTLGYRVGWRNGSSPLFVRVLTDYEAVVRRDIERRICPRIAHPTPKIVALKSPKPVTVSEAVRMMKRKTAGFKF